MLSFSLIRIKHFRASIAIFLTPFPIDSSFINCELCENICKWIGEKLVEFHCNTLECRLNAICKFCKFCKLFKMIANFPFIHSQTNNDRKKEFYYHSKLSWNTVTFKRKLSRNFNIFWFVSHHWSPFRIYSTFRLWFHSIISDF